MKKNNLLLSYILGIASVILLIPIVENMADAICGYIELLKMRSTKAILRGNVDIIKLQQENEEATTEVNTNAIGFQYNDEDDYWYDEEE